MAATEWQEVWSDYKKWMDQCGESNADELSRVRRMIPIVLQQECTDRQRDFILAFFAEGKTMREIAKIYDVNPSTVSRVIDAGLCSLWSHLRYVSPFLATAPRSDVRLDKGRKYKKEL